MIDDPNNPPPEGEDHPLHFPVPEVPDDVPTFDAQAFKDIEAGANAALAEAGLVSPSGGTEDAPRTGADGRPIPVDKSFSELFPNEGKAAEIRGWDDFMVLMRNIDDNIQEMRDKYLGS